MGYGYVTAAHEIIHGQRALAQAGLRAETVDTPLEAIGALSSGIDTATSGTLSGIVGLSIDALAPGYGPRALRETVAYTSAIQRSEVAALRARRSAESGQMIRSARLIGGDRAAQLAGAFASTQQSVTGINARIEDLSQQLGAAPLNRGTAWEFYASPFAGVIGMANTQAPWETGDQRRLRASREGELAALRQQLGSEVADLSERGRQMLMARAFDRQGILDRTAAFADEAAGASPAVAARNAMLRRHRTEMVRQGQEDSSLVPDLYRQQQAESQSFEIQQRRENHLRDIESGARVRSLNLSAQDRPFEARLEAARGRGQAALFEARGDHAEYTRRLRESVAERQGMIADEARRRGIEAIETTGATEALQLGNARQPMLAGLRELNAERDAALAKAQRDNPAQLGRLRSYYAERAISTVRQFNDRRTLTGMGLNTQERVTGILADRGMPWGERQAGAEAAGIAGNARQRAEAFEQEGEYGFAAQERRIGVNTLRAASERLRHSLRVEEIEGINRTDLSSGSNVSRQFAAYRAAEREIGGGSGSGSGEGGGDAASWRQEMLRKMDQLIDKAGAGVGP